MCVILAVILVQTNIYCRHSAAATYLYICIFVYYTLYMLGRLLKYLL